MSGPQNEVPPLQSRIIALSEDDWNIAVDGTLDVIELLNDLRNVLWDLSYAKDLDQPGVNSILRLAGRAAQSLEAKEIPVLDRLAHACLHANPSAVANRGGKL